MLDAAGEKSNRHIDATEQVQSDISTRYSTGVNAIRGERSKAVDIDQGAAQGYQDQCHCGQKLPQYKVPYWQWRSFQNFKGAVPVFITETFHGDGRYQKKHDIRGDGKK